MDNNKTNALYISGLVAVLVLIGVAFWFFASPKNANDNPLDTDFIADFGDCVDAGYGVMDGYPRKCSTPDGKIYTENSDVVAVPGTGECFIGGCSNQICSDQKDVVSTCEFREEYACYKSATCERQPSGQCGWTPTTQLSACLNAVVYPSFDMK